VQTNVEVELAFIDSDDRLIRDLERQLMTAARPHDPDTLKRLPSVPGMGPIVSLVRLYAIQDIHRFPRVQDVASSGRVVTRAHASAGQRDGTSGHNIGNGHLKWAFSEAAVLFLLENPPGPKDSKRREKTYGPGTALTVLAHTLARAGYPL
jgi:transposase